MIIRDLIAKLRNKGEKDIADAIAAQEAIAILEEGEFLILPESSRGLKIEIIRAGYRACIARLAQSLAKQ